MKLYAEDIDVIRNALQLYLVERRRQFHHAAAECNEEQALKLSIEYGADRDYILGLIRTVESSKMEHSAREAPDPVTEGSSDE